MFLSPKGLLLMAIVIAFALLGAVGMSQTAVSQGPVKPVKNDGVSVVNLTSGTPVDTGDEFEQVPISLNGASDYTFTQKAGEVVELVATAEISRSPDMKFCDMAVFVYDENTQVGVNLMEASERGGVPWPYSGTNGFAARATDRTIVLKAAAQEMDGCDKEVEGEVQEELEDTYTVEELDISLITYRD